MANVYMPGINTVPGMQMNLPAGFSMGTPNNSTSQLANLFNNQASGNYQTGGQQLDNRFDGMRNVMAGAMSGGVQNGANVSIGANSGQASIMAPNVYGSQNQSPLVYGPPMSQYGYGYAPNQGDRGFYSQQTPIGEVAQANYSTSQGAQQQPTMFGQAYTAGNQYLGQTTNGIGQGMSVMPYAQQVANASQKSNPYLGQTTQQAAQVGPNPYAGTSNPYLQSQIDAAQADASRAFNLTTRPAFDAANRASGSFGNSAIQEYQQNAYNDFGKNLGNIASSMRMQDYTQQQQLAENALNRQQQTNQFNAGLNAADLSRNLGGFYTGQGIGINGLNSLVGAAQFDSGQGVDVNKFNAGLSSSDLNRNASLAQSMGQFNAGQQQNAGFQNAQAGNQANQFWGQLGQQNNQFNAGQINGTNQYNTGALNQLGNQFRQNQWQAGQNQANRDQAQSQFDSNFNFGVDNANYNRERQGTQDQIALLGQMLGWNQTGISNSTNANNAAIDQWLKLVGGGSQLAGQGGTGTTSQNLQGNPYLGALGGWLMANKFFGG